jgi:hypothetical protein
MLAELTILLALGNVILAILIVLQLKGVKKTMPKSKKAQIQEAPEEQEPEPEPEPLPEPERIIKKVSRIKDRILKKKDTKTKKHVSEKPNMDKVMQELSAEFKQSKKEKKKKGRKGKNEIEERIEEIEES